MIQKLKHLKHYLLMAVTLFMLAAPVMVPVTANAAGDGGDGSGTACGTDNCCAGSSDTAGDIATGVNDATGASASTKVSCNGTNVSTSEIGKAAHTLVQLFSIVVGVVAIIMIIYGGFRYITSGGDSGRVGSGKNTLIYAVVGLVIVALAQLIVHFVLNQSSQINTTSTSSNGQAQNNP